MLDFSPHEAKGHGENKKKACKKNAADVNKHQTANKEPNEWSA